MTKPDSTPAKLPQKTLFDTWVGRLLGLTKLEHIYKNMPPSDSAQSFAKKAIGVMGATYHVNPNDMKRIPKEGPLVVIANHPYGAMDGMMLADFLLDVRPDVKIIANFFLQRLVEMQDTFLSVDPFGGSQANARSVAGLREAMRWVEEGHALAIFPAGKVAHFRLTHGKVTDPDWLTTAAGIIHKTHASVVPMHISGCNSFLFHASGFIHPKLRTVMIPREVLNKKGKRVVMRVGRAITYKKLKVWKTKQALTDYLRIRTFALGELKSKQTLKTRIRSLKMHQKKIPPHVIDEIPKQTLIDEVHALGDKHLLASNQDMSVYYAKATDIPNLLPAIGRAREICFRETGEGTGLAVDVTHYDDYYTQLFLWDKHKQCIAGGYRLGHVDDIVKEHGVKGLYIYSSFKFNQKILDKMNPALELSRSFVVSEYQKSFAPLVLLWKGIAAYVAQHPRYHTLVGVPTISNDYESASQQFMVAFLSEHSASADLTRKIKARSPFPLQRAMTKKPMRELIQELDELSALVGDIQSDDRNVPVLLRQYIKLGAQILGFNIDHSFNDAIDCLIKVDLLKTDRKILGRYMGQGTLEKYYAHHGVEHAA